MLINPSYSFYFENNWVQSDNITTDFVDHTNHFEKGNSMELRSYNHNGEPHIFQAKKYFEKFLFDNEKHGIKSEKSSQDLLNISYELLDRNKLVNAKIFLIGYAKAGQSYFSLSASEAGPIGVKENVELTNYSESNLTDSVNGEVNHSSIRSLFFTKDDVLYTTRVSQGETVSFLRDAIVESAIKLGFPVIEKSISAEELKESDVVFFSDNSNEINMVKRFDDHTFTSNWRETSVMDILMLFRNQASNDGTVEDAII